MSYQECLGKWGDIKNGQGFRRAVANAFVLDPCPLGSQERLKVAHISVSVVRFLQSNWSTNSRGACKRLMMRRPHSKLPLSVWRPVLTLTTEWPQSERLGIQQAWRPAAPVTKLQLPCAVLTTGTNILSAPCSLWW